MGENTQPPKEGSKEWREKAQALILAPSPFNWTRSYAPEDGALFFDLDIDEWSISIVPEWNAETQTFDNYMLSMQDDNPFAYEGEDNWESFSEAQQAVEEMIADFLTRLISHAFVSFSEGLTLLYECSKKHRDYKPEEE
jgi:hypothetical protein